MNLYDYLNAGEVASYIESLPSNSIKYLGSQLFPNAQSHPTWVRGLKSVGGLYIAVLSTSHPTWVRGLK